MDGDALWDIAAKYGIPTSSALLEQVVIALCTEIKEQNATITSLNEKLNEALERITALEETAHDH